MNNLQRRAARIAEEAKAETRYISGTEPKKLAEVRPIGNSKRNRDTARSTIESLRESLK